ncbi:MAG TPA: S46 family peptidase [Terracidiphilus sp.]|nr:S46 family peptidase [Terracidiphilus sp.]
MMKRTVPLFCLLVFLLAAGSAIFADEGMWLFNHFPKDKIQAKYGFAPDQAWLDHVRLASPRAPDGSSSFVSPNGLLFTNHHIAQGCIHDISTAGKDYMKDGFYAPTYADEAKCPGMEFVVLEGIEDVTAQVNAAVKPGMSTAEAGKAQREEMAALEKQCSSGDIRCDVVTLYSGAMYNLYKYKKYDDIRLVFAPEFDIAFFGGDPDNFEYPRYDLDISFLRAYENGQPAKTPDYLKWSPNGASQGELIFVSGNPGRTGRLLTMDQLAFLRDDQYPLLLSSLTRRIGVLQKFSAESAENAREAESNMFGLQNSFKAITGYEDGLKDKELMAKKAAAENSLKEFVNSSPERKTEFDDPWAQISQAVEVEKQIYKQVIYLNGAGFAGPGGFRGELAAYAREIVRAAYQREKPNNQRMRGFQDAQLPTLEQRLFSTAPVYKGLEQVLLSESLAEMRDELGADNPAVQKALAGKTPEERAKELIEGTKLEDVAVRKQLFEGGMTAVDASTDPLIVLMREIEPDAEALYNRDENEVQAVLRQGGSNIGKALFAQKGLSVPPDATFTLRLSYGAVKGYMLDGKHVPWFTTMGGAYEHAAAHGSKPPYQLPESWLKYKSVLDLKTPLDTVSTADIIGGNSGSPVINKAGEVVGIVFDGNIEMLAGNFEYSDKVSRAVEVDTRGITEALRKIYHADALLNELMPKPATKPNPVTKMRRPTPRQPQQ